MSIGGHIHSSFTYFDVHSILKKILATQILFGDYSVTPTFFMMLIEIITFCLDEVSSHLEHLFLKGTSKKHFSPKLIVCQI